MAEEKGRRLGRYLVVERTARRLVVEARGKPLVAVGVVWGTVVLIAVAVAPWLGGTRLYIAVATAVVAAGISLLALYFVPRRERIAVDLEIGEFRAERSYLLPPRSHGIRVPLAAAGGVRCRRRYWREGPGVEATRWTVELTGEGGEVWRLAEGDVEEPIRELARLVAEVAGLSLVCE